MSKTSKSKERFRIAVLVSGNGSNLEAILKASKKDKLAGGEVVLVISSKPEVFALERARKYGIKTEVIDPKAFKDDATFQEAMLKALNEDKINLICLAGYLRKVGPQLITLYRGKIVNIHPALLPKYGGAGMYGRRVHEAVLAARETESGCSVHIVDEEFDHGPVVAQARVQVVAGDTPEALAARILEQEHKLYPEAIKKLCQQLTASGKEAS